MPRYLVTCYFCETASVEVEARDAKEARKKGKAETAEFIGGLGEEPWKIKVKEVKP